MSARALPWWGEALVLPAVNLAVSLALAGLVVLAAGADPRAALSALVVGAAGDGEAIGYTLYYATDLIFAGLAVAVAFHAGLFNIGAEGQATIGGLFATLVCLSPLPGWAMLPLAIAAAGAGGAAWAAIPGWLQARRGSHIVITTIMFNFIAASLMVYLLAGPLLAPGQMSPETRPFPAAASLPPLAGLTGLPPSPANAALVLALLACGLVWLLLWRTRFGYALRVAGTQPRAAIYAGIDPGRITILAMLISGALAGGVAVNEVLGVQHRLMVGFTSGTGFTGIAVALMGRNHPVGIVLAALLFGALLQGGAEMSFDLPRVSADLVVAIQGLMILMMGGLGLALRPALARLIGRAPS